MRRLIVPGETSGPDEGKGGGAPERMAGQQRSQFLQTSLHYGPLGAGLRLAPWTATLFLVAPRAGALVNRVGERALLVAGLTLQALGFGWLALIAKPGVTYISMVVPMVVAGLGASMAMPAAQNCVLGSVPRWAMGKASGAFNTLRQLGGTFGIAIAAAAFSEHGGGYTSGSAFSHGFSAAIWACAGLSILGAAAGTWAPSRALRRHRMAQVDDGAASGPPAVETVALGDTAMPPEARAAVPVGAR